MVVGAYALAHHGALRFMGDIDVCVRPTPENAARVLGARNRRGRCAIPTIPTPRPRVGK